MISTPCCATATACARWSPTLPPSRNCLRRLLPPRLLTQEQGEAVRGLWQRLFRVRKNKTINLVLGTIRHVLNLAARKWRVEGNLRLTWLVQAPLISMLSAPF